MGRGIALTETQWDELDRVRLTTDSADVFRNCLIVLMSDSRDTIARIAQRLGCGTDTVVRIRRLYRQGGVQALYPGHSPGHLAKITGIRFSADQLARLLHRQGFSIHRPKHTLKGKRDEAQYAQAKSGQSFLLFLMALLAAYAGQKVRLVCDNARFHQTQAVRRWLRMNRHRVEIFWLPPYCPSLNLIERLWGHLKRTVLANVLFATMEDLVAAFRRGVLRINGHRSEMGFIFNHDDIRKKAA